MIPRPFASLAFTEIERFFGFAMKLATALPSALALSEPPSNCGMPSAACVPQTARKLSGVVFEPPRPAR